MSDNCKSRQDEEIEALSAIYDLDFHVEDKDERIYAIDIKEGEIESVLQVKLTPGYPEMGPPCYELSAPWLKGEKRQDLYGYLNDIYLVYTGEAILYRWVERIREFMINQTDEMCNKNLDSQIEDQTPDSREENTIIDMPEIISGDTIVDRKSIFQPHLAKVTSVTDVKNVLNELLKNRKIQSATHNMYAYRIVQPNSNILIQECDDDGEDHAGSRMLFVLRVCEAENVMVVVTRWYGGIHLGPDRFKHINNATRSILDACGYIKSEKRSKKKT